MSYLKIGIFSLFCCVFYFGSPLWAAPGIKITSPADRAIVKPGEEVSVTIEAVDGFLLKEGMILFTGGKIYDENLRSLPAIRTFKISQRAMGTIGVLVLARSVDGVEASDRVTLVAEPKVVAQSLILRPGGVTFYVDWEGELDKRWDNFGYIGVDGVFADGQTRAVDEFATFSTTDPSVVSVEPGGKFTVHRPGQVKAYVTCLGVTQEVPISFIKPQGRKPSETGRPVTTIQMDPLPNTAGWHRADVKVTLTAKDNEGGSGVRSIEYYPGSRQPRQYLKSDTAVFYMSQEGDNETLSFAADDKEGNFEYTREVVFKIDKTPPQVLIEAPAQGAEYALNARALAVWSAADALSGIETVSGTVASGAALDTARVGPKDFIVVAADRAGHQTRVARAYRVRYLFGGFLAPIDAAGVRLFKLGSVIPVKFQLRDALGAFVSSAVARIYLNKVSDSAIGQEVVAVSPGQANTDNLFRYDSAGGQYIFNLGTKSLSAGTWQIRIDLDDGSSQYARIALK